MTLAKVAAKKVLSDCGLTDPTDLSLKEVILGRKAFYEEKPLFGKEGEIISLGDRSIITINSRIQFESKKRFVAAHELGHYEMHRELIPTAICDTEFDLINWYRAGKQEVEANGFAAEFLMPSELFLDECRDRSFGPDVIDHLAARFQVSKTAAVLRFVKHGNYPVCVVYCINNQMKWWKKSDDFKYFLQFEYKMPPPGGSVAEELFSQNFHYFEDERKQQIFKSIWFDLGVEEQDQLIYEFCLYAKSYNYSLSVIWED